MSAVIFGSWPLATINAVASKIGWSENEDLETQTQQYTSYCANAEKNYHDAPYERRQPRYRRPLIVSSCSIPEPRASLPIGAERSLCGARSSQSWGNSSLTRNGGSSVGSCNPMMLNGKILYARTSFSWRFGVTNILKSRITIPCGRHWPPSWPLSFPVRRMARIRKSYTRPKSIRAKSRRTSRDYPQRWSMPSFALQLRTHREFETPPQMRGCGKFGIFSIAGRRCHAAPRLQQPQLRRNDRQPANDSQAGRNAQVVGATRLRT